MRTISEAINEARDRKTIQIELSSDEDVYHILNALYCEYGVMKSEGNSSYLEAYENVYSKVCKAATAAGIELDPDYNRPLSKVRV